MTIRAATLDDLPYILEIERGCDTAPHWSETEYRRIVTDESPVSRCLLVADQGFAAGSVVGERGELETVVVRPTARRQGTGGALCRAVIQWCRQQGAASVELEVRAASVGARRLYESLGWRPTGCRSGYYNHPPDDAIVMRLELNLSSDTDV